MILYEYKNQKWKSQVNDFGDDYHKESFKSDLISNDDYSKLTKVKRRYRDFDTYCDAMQLVNNYLESLVYKYGGKKRFLMLYQMGLISDYIPKIPVLRKVAKTKVYIDTNMPKVFEESVEVDHSWIKEGDADRKVRISFSMKNDSEDEFVKLAKGNGDARRNVIAEEIGIIEQWYREKADRVTKLSKRARKRQMKKRKVAKARDRMTATQRVEEYYRKKDMGYYDDYDPEAIVSYKGTTFTREQKEEYEAYDLLRECGFTLGKKNLSKGIRKIVRRKEKKIKKVKKKEAKAAGLRKKYLDRFTNGEYETFSDFEKEVHSFIGSKIRGNR